MKQTTTKKHSENILGKAGKKKKNRNIEEAVQIMDIMRNEIIRIAE